MSEYKRLTLKDFVYADEMGARLQAFENALESGELITKEEYLKRCHEMYEQGKFDAMEDEEYGGELVRVPCKVGDTVYGVGFNDCAEDYTNDPKLLAEIMEYCNTMEDGCYGCKYVRHRIEKFVCAQIQVNENEVLIIGKQCESYRIENVFTAHKQAFKRLKELEGK